MQLTQIDGSNSGCWIVHLDRIDATFGKLVSACLIRNERPNDRCFTITLHETRICGRMVPSRNEFWEL